MIAAIYARKSTEQNGVADEQKSVARQVDCELRDHGPYGWEAQFLLDREFYLSRRFDTKELAIQWAELEREHMEKGDV